MSTCQQRKKTFILEEIKLAERGKNKTSRMWNDQTFWRIQKKSSTAFGAMQGEIRSHASRLCDVIVTSCTKASVNSNDFERAILKTVDSQQSNHSVPRNLNDYGVTQLCDFHVSFIHTTKCGLPFSFLFFFPPFFVSLISRFAALPLRQLANRLVSHAFRKTKWRNSGSSILVSFIPFPFFFFKLFIHWLTVRLCLNEKRQKPTHTHTHKKRSKVTQEFEQTKFRRTKEIKREIINSWERNCFIVFRQTLSLGLL